MIKSTDIDFQLITPTQFEQLCFKLISKIGYEKVRWRQGGADNGRDIQAVKRVQNDLVLYDDIWFFECKHYVGGVPPAEFESKFAWANAKQPEHLVFILSSHITNNGETYLEERAEGVNYKVHLIQGNELKEVLIKHIDLIKEFGLISSDLALIQLLKDKWIIHDEIADWHPVITTTQTTNYEHLSINEIFLLSALLEIHDKINYSTGKHNEDSFYDKKHEVIELAIKVSEETDSGKERFSLEIFDHIEWIEEENYGEICYDYDNEDYFPHSSVNKVKLNGVPGLFGFITTIKEENKIIVPYFLTQDSSLTLQLFSQINSEELNIIMSGYIESRPAKPEVSNTELTMDTFEWDDIIDSEE
ncbi:MAG TPA: restriction endonuclease [Flavobacterium sp.]|nr:restriction endonuclease [Flavobacterium sp.]